MNCCTKPAQSPRQHTTLAVSTKFDIEFDDYDFGRESRSFVIKSDDESDETKYMDALSLVEDNQTVRTRREGKHQEQCEYKQQQQQETKRQSQRQWRRNSQSSHSQTSKTYHKKHSLSPRIQIATPKASNGEHQEEVELELPIMASDSTFSRQRSNISNITEEYCSSGEYYSASGGTRPPLPAATEDRSDHEKSDEKMKDVQQQLKESLVQLRATQQELATSQGELKDIQEKAQLCKHELSKFKTEWEAQERAMVNKEHQISNLRAELLEKTKTIADLKHSKTERERQYQSLLDEKTEDLNKTYVALEKCHESLVESKQNINAKSNELLQYQTALSEMKKELSNTKAELSRTKLQVESATKRKKQFSSKALEILKGKGKADTSGNENSVADISSETLQRSKSCSNFAGYLGTMPPKCDISSKVTEKDNCTSPKNAEGLQKLQTTTCEVGTQVDLYEPGQDCTKQCDNNKKQDQAMSKPVRTTDSDVNDGGYHDSSNTICTGATTISNAHSTFRQQKIKKTISNDVQGDGDGDDGKTVDSIFGEWHDSSNSTMTSDAGSTASRTSSNSHDESPDRIIEYSPGTFTAAPSRSSTYVTTSTSSQDTALSLCSSGSLHSDTGDAKIVQRQINDCRNADEEEKITKLQEQRTIHKMARRLSSLSDVHHDPLSIPERGLSVCVDASNVCTFAVSGVKGTALLVVATGITFALVTKYISSALGMTEILSTAATLSVLLANALLYKTVCKTKDFAGSKKALKGKE